jgi:hypothetical protein
MVRWLLKKHGEYADWMRLAEDTLQWRTVVNTEMNIQVETLSAAPAELHSVDISVYLTTLSVARLYRVERKNDTRIMN